MGMFSDYILSLSPRGYWRLNEASGNPQDSSGNANHMDSNTAAEVYLQAGAIVGDADTSIRLGASGMFGRSTGLANPPTTAMTAAISAKMVGTAADWSWLLLYGWAVPGGWALREEAIGTAFVVISSDGGHRVAIVTSTIPRDGAFHRLIGTYDGTDVKHYVDGALVGSTSIVNPPTLYSSTVNPFHIGNLSSGVTVTVDEAAIFGYAWTAAQVATDYRMTKGASVLVGSAGSF